MIRCNNCMQEFANDWELEQLVDEGHTDADMQGEVVHGCPTCRTDAYLMNITMEGTR